MERRTNPKPCRYCQTLPRGNERYLELVTDYAKNADESIKKLPTSFDALHKRIVTSLTNLKQYATNTKSKLTKEDQKKLEESGLIKKLNEITISKLALLTSSLRLRSPGLGNEKYTNKQLLGFGESLTEYVAALKELDTNLKTNKDAISELWTVADKVLKQKGDKSWTDLELNNLAKTLAELQQAWKSDIEQDYSLNAGRYVGVEIEGDDMSQEEFNSLLKVKSSEFEKLNSASASIEKNILVGLKELVKGK